MVYSDFVNGFDEDDLKAANGNLKGMLEAAFFTPQEQGQFSVKVNVFLKDKGIGLDFFA